MDPDKLTGSVAMGAGLWTLLFGNIPLALVLIAMALILLDPFTEDI